MKQEDIILPSPLKKDDLKNIIYGSCFFASGGGGPLKMAIDFLDKMNFDYDDKKLICINTEQIDPDKKAFIVADMGSPDQALKHHLGYTAPVNAYRALKDYLKNKGETVSYLLPFELGAVNTLLPFYIVSKVDDDIQVINGDPAGRSVPTIGMTLFHTKGDPIAICPAAVASDSDKNTQKYKTIIFDDPDIDPDDLEYKAGQSVESWGKVGGLACYPTDGARLKASGHNGKNRDKLIQGSIGLCWDVGKKILERFSLDDLRSHLESSYGIKSFILIENATARDPVGKRSILDMGKYIMINEITGEEIWIYFENESLFACEPPKEPDMMGPIRAMGPDIITFLTADNNTYPAGTPVSNADLILNEKYTVLGLTSDARIRNEPMIISFQEKINDLLQEKEKGENIITQYIPIEKLNP